MKNMLNYIVNLSLIKKYFLLGLLLHLISCYFSIGFYKDDEHFQIYEPVAYLLGLSDSLFNNSDWYWEYYYAMRPWLQPYIYHNLIIFFKFIGIDNSFDWSFIIRLITSLIGYLSITYLFLTIKNIFYYKENHFNYLLFFTFWFYPFMHSRSSSENLGIILFTFAFCFLYKQIVNNNQSKLNFFSILFFGIILGFSLVIRLNLVFTILPIFLWVLIFRFNFKKILCVFVGVSIAMLLGIIVDYFHYDKLTISYWNLFNINILEGRMEGFGTQPWWYYLPTIAIELAPILSIFFIISLIIFWIKKPMNIITWLTLITLIIISLFGHKEIRFAFPIYIFAPFFISYFFEIFPDIKFNNLLKILILISNFLFLSLTLFTPANGKVAIYNYLYNNNINQDKVYFVDENPYLINGMEPFFYTSFLPKIHKLTNDKFDYINKNNFWIITNNYKEYKKIVKKNSCIKKYNSFPEKLISINQNWQHQRFNWYIVFCKR